LRLLGKPQVHLEKRAVALEEASLLDEYEGGRPQQIFSRILSEEIADKEPVWPTATEKGSAVCGGHQVNQGNLCALERSAEL
jgi:hypothetical protein